MDMQTLINVVAGGALAAVGWFARQMWGAVNELRADLSKLREELPSRYVAKDDFRDAVQELKSLLIDINHKLDRKADK